MSYREVFQRVITIRGEKKVSINGEEHRIQYVHEEPVTIEIEVETEPFDHSVSEAEHRIHDLTNSVTQAGMAQVAAKRASAAIVSDAIVKGFFNKIKSEIHQHLAQIKPKVSALFLELRQYQDVCVNRRRQLESDFNNIAERYTGIFATLDRELQNRIGTLNDPLNILQGHVSRQLDKAFVAVGGALLPLIDQKGGGMPVMLQAASVKFKALDLVGHATNYIKAEMQLSSTMRRVLLAEGCSTKEEKYVPVLYIEKLEPDAAIDKVVYANEHATALNAKKEDLKSRFQEQHRPWYPMDAQSRSQIDHFLRQYIAFNSQSLGNGTAERILELWNRNQDIKTNY